LNYIPLADISECFAVAAFTIRCSDEIGRAFLLVGKPLKDEDILAWLNEFDADGSYVLKVCL